MASPLADFVISLADGHVISQGSVSDALKKDNKLAEEFKHEEEALELEVTEEAEALGSTEDAAAPTRAKEGKLVVAEEIAVGHVSWQACEYYWHCSAYLILMLAASVKLFLAGLGGKWPLLFWLQYLAGSSGSILIDVSQLWWLGHWAQQYTFRDPKEVEVG